METETGMGRTHLRPLISPIGSCVAEARSSWSPLETRDCVTLLLHHIPLLFTIQDQQPATSPRRPPDKNMLRLPPLYSFPGVSPKNMN